MTFEEFCYLHDIKINVIKMPTSLRGFAYYRCDMFFVCINSQLAFAQQQDTMLHELVHILENHFVVSIYDHDMVEKKTKLILNDLKINGGVI